MISLLPVITFRQPAGHIPPGDASLGEAHLCDLYREDSRGELHCLHLPAVRVSPQGAPVPLREVKLVSLLTDDPPFSTALMIYRLSTFPYVLLSGL